jgi:phosphatidylserine/phosphatidylglycerophosphate/cardiolipin synthase-like enzyme
MARSSFRSLTAVVIAVAGLGAVALRTGGEYFSKPIVPGQVDVFFSPKGGCTEAVVSALRKAKQSVYVQAYSFTNAEIARALVDAHRRGVKVSIILDKSQETEQYSEADFTSRAGIATSIDAAHAIAHNKVMIIDEATVITGSFNFTTAAEQKNAENLVIIHETPELAAKYLKNWRAHYAHSSRFVRGATAVRGRKKEEGFKLHIF